MNKIKLMCGGVAVLSICWLACLAAPQPQPNGEIDQLAEAMFRRWAWARCPGNTVDHSNEVQAAWIALSPDEWGAWQDLACFTIHGGFSNVVRSANTRLTGTPNGGG